MSCLLLTIIHACEEDPKLCAYAISVGVALIVVTIIQWWENK